MIEIFMTNEDSMSEIDEYVDGSWIALTDPTAPELLEVAERFNIDVDHLRAPLDEEERSTLGISTTISVYVSSISILDRSSSSSGALR